MVLDIMNDVINKLIILFPNILERMSIHNNNEKYIFTQEIKGLSNLVIRVTDSSLRGFIIKIAIDPNRYMNIKNEYLKLIFLKEYNIFSPKPLLYEDDDSIIGFPFLITSIIDGYNLEDIWLNTNHDYLGENMGRILKELHCIKGDYYSNSKGEKIDNWSVYIIDEINRYIEIFSERNIFDKKIVLKINKYIDESIIYSNERPSFIHKDFQFRNLLVNKINEDFEIIGICDFESSFWGPPELEFAIIERFIFSQYPRLRDIIISSYMKEGNINNFWRKVKIYDIFQTLRFISKSARDNNNEKLLKHVTYLRRTL